MPTRYLTATEEAALNEFIKKVDREDKVLSFSRPEPPDCLIHTKSGCVFWIEITAAYRNGELAKFLNKNGLVGSFSENFKAHSECLGDIVTYIDKLALSIRTSILKKDAKKSYSQCVKDYGKGVLIVYLDDPVFGSHDELNSLLSRFDKQLMLEQFRETYLYLRPACTLSSEVTQIGGLYLLGKFKCGN